MLHRLTLFWRRFTPLEQRVLAEVRRVLPGRAVSLFDTQVAAVNRVQRLPPSWAEIYLYRIRRRRPVWAGVPLFPRTDEFRLAEVRFRVAGTPYRAVVSCLAGRLCDLAILPGPRDVAFAPWDEAVAAMLLADPLHPSPGGAAPERLPDRWRRLLARYPSRGPRGWTLYDASTAYRVICGDVEYLVLAEGEGPRFILLRVDPPGEQLYWLEHHDGRPTRLDQDPEAIV